MRIHRAFAASLFVLSSCASPSAPVDGGTDDDAPVVEDPACETGGLEPDLRPAPFSGPAVDASGAVAAGTYVLSTTRLRIRRTAEAPRRFAELMRDIASALDTQPGLLAYSVATSERCGVARTLSVWRDEAAMYGFVSSPPHRAAASAVGEVSRGGSRVTHWDGDQSDAQWARAAAALAASEGPSY